jgi:hypothetical protein
VLLLSWFLNQCVYVDGVLDRDISVQLKRHTEERVAQFQENEKLKEKLSQLLKFEELREEHFNQQLRTKELENKLTDGNTIHIICIYTRIIN